jgi:CheY-like chemotaxis protein
MGRVALVVDDSMLVRHTVCRFLEERGFIVESATNGREALDLLSKLRPDFIFTDLQMPMMSGSELISAVRARPDMASIPMVIAGKKGASNSEPEIRSDFVIYKDIDIVQQLERAITALTQSPVASCQSPVKPKTS